MSYVKKPSFLLFLILAAFLSREFFLAGAFPLFTGQDEARHYNTLQWLSKTQDPNCFKSANTLTQEKDNLATYRFSEEIRETSTAAGLSIWREENYRKPTFTPHILGTNESVLQEQKWSKATPCPPDVAISSSRFSFFHWLGSRIETAWSNSDILTRFYLARLLSVFLGGATILFAYFAAREAQFSSRTSLLIALIISLQPRLSIYTTNINYDTLLIPCFAFFTWAGLKMLHSGFTIPNTLLILLALTFAILTKGTSLILLGGVFFLGAWLLFQKRNFWKNIAPSHWLLGGILILTLILFANHTYPFFNLLPEFSLPSLLEYLSKSLPRIPDASENFWGKLSWNAAVLGPWFVCAIWAVELFALYGLFRFFIRKEPLPFLPTKSVALFALILIGCLQIGVRFYDWHIYQNTGSLALGTPGRYFLPTLLPQLLLIAVGLGALLRKKIWLERALVVLALIMLAFNLYTVWLIIIPRFYL